VHIVDEVRHHTAERGIPMAGPTNPVLLTSLDSTQRSSDVRLGSAELSGRYFGDSIIFQPSLFASPVRGTISYNLGMRFRRLEVTAGVLDNAAERDQIGVFKVITDGAVRTQVTAEHGRPKELSIDVTDVLSLQLEAHRPGTTVHPMMAGVMAAGGRSNKLPELAWGDPVVYP
jgi:NPCBM/NEW2 domain